MSWMSIGFVAFPPKRYNASVASVAKSSLIKGYIFSKLINFSHKINHATQNMQTYFTSNQIKISIWIFRVIL